MAIIVLELVPLVFQRIKRLIFDFPPGSSAPHELIHRAFIHAQLWPASSCRRADAAPPWRGTRSGFHGIGWEPRSEVRLKLRGIESKDRGGLLQAVKQSFEQMPHRLQGVISKQGSHPFPKSTFAPQFGPHRLEERAAQLLDLIH